jgi:hypothetical protein
MSAMWAAIGTNNLTQETLMAASNRAPGRATPLTMPVKWLRVVDIRSAVLG